MRRLILWRSTSAARWSAFTGQARDAGSGRLVAFVARPDVAGPRDRLALR